MPKLPVVSGQELVRILIEKKGYQIRSRKGSHVILIHSVLSPLTVPMHREIRPGLLLSIIKTAGLEREELSRR
ncbi:MAG: type II toxin-antitoxin system HicA family toxin [Candidatus Micrarchaeota archaeon]